MATQIDKKETLTRGFFNKCPQCGEGRMLHTYITPYKECSHCTLDFDLLRADDGPAWATVLITGHLTMPFVFWMLEWGLDNIWLEILLPCLFIVGLSIIILPRAKGIFMAIIWMMHINKPPEDQDSDPATTSNSLP